MSQAGSSLFAISDLTLHWNPKLEAPAWVQLRAKKSGQPHMYDYVDESSVTDLVIWAAILIAFFCLLRKSNYVPVSQKSFNKS